MEEEHMLPCLAILTAILKLSFKKLLVQNYVVSRIIQPLTLFYK